MLFPNFTIWIKEAKEAAPAEKLKREEHETVEIIPQKAEAAKEAKAKKKKDSEDKAEAKAKAEDDDMNDAW